MKDKNEIIEQVMQHSGIKEKVDAAFVELEEQAKEKLIAELETALRAKLEKELTKVLRKREAKIKAKVKKRVRRLAVISVVCACSGLLLSSAEALIPVLLKKRK